jgi:hypothetical protein
MTTDENPEKRCMFCSQGRPILWGICDDHMAQLTKYFAERPAPPDQSGATNGTEDDATYQNG